MPILDFQTIGMAVVVLVVGGERLVALLNHWRQRDRQFEPKHNPEIHDVFAHKEHVDGSLNQVRLDLKDVATKGEQSRFRLHESIREVRERVSALEKGQEMTYTSTIRVEDSINKLRSELGKK